MGTPFRVSASAPPDFISLERHRDNDRTVEKWVRRVVLAVLLGLTIAALADVFGQRPSTNEVVAPGATLRLTGPHAVRGGLLYEGKVHVLATRRLERPTIVLDEGWIDGFTLNAIVPEPLKETSEPDGVALEFAPLDAGETLTVFLSNHVDPTTVGRHSQGVRLRDGAQQLVELARTVTVFP
jgi:hypothetical protein